MGSSIMVSFKIAILLVLVNFLAAYRYHPQHRHHPNNNDQPIRCVVSRDDRTPNYPGNHNHPRGHMWMMGDYPAGPMRPMTGEYQDYPEEPMMGEYQDYPYYPEAPMMGAYQDYPYL